MHGAGCLPDVAEDVAELSSALELHLRRGFVHFRLQSLKCFLGLTSERFTGSVHTKPVTCGRKIAQLLRHLIRGRLQFAFRGIAAAKCEHPELFPQESEGLPESARVGKWAEVTGTIVSLDPSQPEPGPVVAEIDFDQEEMFVVAEADVVLGAELLDEPTLEKKGFGLALDRVPFEVPDAFQKRQRFRSAVIFRDGMKYWPTRRRRSRAFPT